MTKVGDIGGKAFRTHNPPAEMEFERPKKSKFCPKGIDPAYPNRNFVKMSIINKGKGTDTDSFEYYREMYGGPSLPTRKPSGFGQQRQGKLRLSGNSKAHRIGKR